MSFCVKCGLQYDESHEHSFCARCGADLRKTTSDQPTTPEPNSIKSSPLMTQSRPGEKKPIAGIVVAMVLGLLSLIWTCAALFHNVFGNPSDLQTLFYQYFPTLQIKNLIGLSLALLGDTALVIGALMAYLDHPNGTRVVRVTSYSMIALTILLVGFSCLAVFGSDAWPALDAPTKGAMIGGLVGGTIGAFVQWGFILVLFRKCHSVSNATTSNKGHKTKMVFIGLGVLLMIVMLIVWFNGLNSNMTNRNGEPQKILQAKNIAVSPPLPAAVKVTPAIQTQEETQFNNDKRSAESGNADAQFYMGLAYSTQTTNFVVGGKDDDESVKWLTKAAEKGLLNAQVAIGGAYYSGRGVNVDKNSAVNWFRKAAEQGSVQGALFLGLCNKYGEGVPINAEEAVKWLTQAANHNDATAQFELGCCYSEYSGMDGAPKNNVFAYK